MVSWRTQLSTLAALLLSAGVHAGTSVAFAGDATTTGRGGQQRSLKHDGNGFLTGKNCDTPGPSPVWDSGEHLYNGRGNLIRLHGGASNIYLDYDALDRLVGYDKSLLGQGNSYSYDVFDNITRIESTFPDWPDIEYVPDPNTNHILAANNVEGQPLAAWETITYDGRGNLIRFGEKWLSFDEMGLQAAYTRDANSVGQALPNPADGYEYQATYAYNAAGQRVFALEHTPRVDDPGDVDFSELTFFARDHGGKVMRELRLVELDELSYRDYVWAGGQLRYEESADARHHVHLDHLGTPRRLTSGSSIVSANQELDPFGNPIPGSQSLGIRAGFTGHEMDRNGIDTEMTDGTALSYNFGARSYVPAIGRFLTPDPARDPSSWSLYGYAGNSPMMNVDPDGRESAAIRVDQGVKDIMEGGEAYWQDPILRKTTVLVLAVANPIPGDEVALATTVGGKALSSLARATGFIGRVKRAVKAFFGKGRTKVPGGRVGGPLARQSRQELLKSKRSFERLVSDHRQKLADFKADPLAFDNKGILRNAPEELRPQIIEGRIRAIEKQISKQEGELQRIREFLGETR